MLTTTVDGLWALQVLAGIEVVAPELGLRPFLPSAETAAAALQHPVTADLHHAGAITGDGVVDPVIVEWLTVLSRRDVAVLLCAQTPGAEPAPRRVVLARFAHWWAALERTGEVIRVSGIGTAGDEESAGRLIGSEIRRLCGDLSPAQIRPVTVDVQQLLDRVQDRESLRAYLIEQRLDRDQVALLTVASDTDRSAQASIVAIQSGVPGRPTRSHIDPGAVTIIDTDQGRLMAEFVSTGDMKWMVVAPGTAGAIGAAVRSMMRRLPADNDWHSYRKVV